MLPTLADLMAALPDAAERDDRAPDDKLLRMLAEKVSGKPLPAGSLKRLSLLGSLQAKIAVAYLFYWIGSWFKSPEERKRQLSETHLRAAVRILDSMSYNRRHRMAS